MENEFNISELKCESGDMVLVHWDNRYKIKTPTIHKDVEDYFKEGVFNTTTLGYIYYKDNNVVVLARNLINESLLEDFVEIPTNLIKNCIVIQKDERRDGTRSGTIIQRPRA